MLDVAGNARSNAWIGRANGSAPTADAAIYRAADNTLGFSTGNTERARIDSSGNVGIGTTAPQATFGGRALQLGTTTDSRAVFTLQSTTSGVGSVYFSDGTSGAATYVGFIEYDHSTDNMVFGTGSTNRARITSSGEFLINTTTTTGNGKFSSNNESASTAGASSARIWNQIKNVAASNNATVDVWLGRDAAGNVIGNNSLVGHFNVFVIGASGANAFAGVYSIITTGNGTSEATLSAVSAVTRGTSPVSSIQIAADGVSGAIKLTVTYINNAGVVTGGNSQVSFIGQII